MLVSFIAAEKSKAHDCYDYASVQDYSYPLFQVLSNLQRESILTTAMSSTGYFNANRSPSCDAYPPRSRLCTQICAAPPLFFHFPCLLEPIVGSQPQQAPSDELPQRLLKYAVNWNTRARTCLIAQRVLNWIVMHWAPEKLLTWPDMAKTIEAMVPYTGTFTFSLSACISFLSIPHDFLSYCIRKVESNNFHSCINPCHP
ncbi:unnamed protein product [Dibothriocephalus latus]|uniref:U3 small nucleolar RNA-associated protein 13 C-terminal domain-containing protein n=1 Tax=Dibothriocephalus latus TaxID=60516 RepID=A0A3P7NKU5_DIBLA|nr:unnamed protein product [Dibothriocephalus latus]